MVCCCRLWATDYITSPKLTGYTPQSNIDFIRLNSDSYEMTKVLVAGSAADQFGPGSSFSGISESRV